ncbi:MAG: GNAT family N-acetyltransferase [Chlamydiae bacterium]|nr:GNAT family N-acetyltransferase [Chlamydiota bacterium]
MDGKTLTIDDPKIAFEPLAADHFILLHKWIQEPHVWQWWGEGKSWTLDEITAKYNSYTLRYKIDRGIKKAIHPFIINFQGQPIGFIQFYNAFDFPRDDGFDVQEIWDRKNESLAALDFYIGEPAYIGKGLGSQVLRFFLQTQVFKQYDACLVDPEKNNKIALKTYSKAGFSTVKDLPSIIIMVARKIEQRKPIVIFGSSRSDGDTLQAIKAVIKDLSVPIIDLKNLNIAHYDYNYENKHDDFMAIAEKMVQHNPIILATPVYWYTMSALMKTFIDRWSDLLDTRKDIGRRLSHKELFVIACYETSLPRGFEDAFSQTCDYLDMQYKGCLYFYSGEDPELAKDNESSAKQFSDRIFYSKENLE